MKEHNKAYRLDRTRGDELAATKGKQLTVVVTDLDTNTVYYRLFSSSNPRIYHWRAPPESPIQPKHLQIGKSYGINTMNRNGKYIWHSTFPLTSSDKFTWLELVDQDPLLDLLNKNDFRQVQEIYFALLTEFELEELTDNQILFIDDVSDVIDYWHETNDSRAIFLHKPLLPQLTNTELVFEVDNCPLFDTTDKIKP